MTRRIHLSLHHSISLQLQFTQTCTMTEVNRNTVNIVRIGIALETYKVNMVRIPIALETYTVNMVRICIA